MHLRRLIPLVALALAACSTGAPHEPDALVAGPVVAARATVAPRDFGALSWRIVGPAVMGGRLDSVAGVPGDPRVLYLGHSSSGLYASKDGGVTFHSIFDAGRSSSIGAVALAPSNPKIIYVGTGEGFPRNTAALGDGVFRSDDGGKTWRSLGLRGTQHIARIAIDPRDPNVALVAAMGPEYTPGGERGIYRTSDGGRHWQRVLAGNPTTGGSDVAFDPSDPAIAFAGTFDYLRRPWTFRGGGTGSGLFRSTDGGRTWTRLTDPARHDGLPGGIINRVGLSISAHHPNVVYAIVPTKHGMLYRSNDGGTSWKLVNADQDLVFRPFYFSQVRADPNRPDDVWIVSGELRRSTDGGKTFKSVEAGGDNHDLWIDPTDGAHVLLGSDMGLHRSIDGGDDWTYLNVLPLSQVYRVGYDRDVPYHIMGGMQDHEVWWGPNTLWNQSGVSDGSWRNISDWGDGQYAMPDPRDSHIIYEDTHFGDLTRRDLRTGEARYISPQPIIAFGTGAGSFPLRFNWSAPLLISRHDPNVLYYGANVLLRSRDQGQSWQTISPDLTLPCDPSWLARSGGPITHDNTNAEAYCTIYAIAEGRAAGSLWIGTDDGHLAHSTDGGATWSDLTANVPGLPAQSWVASIEASRVDAGTAYVTFDRHRFGDTHPYVYVTHDDGAHWTRCDAGLPLWAYVVREDPREPRLLFAGTEDGIYASFDAGAHWHDLLLGTHHVPVYDLQIQPDANDLIAGTHGRGFAILDDITPLEGLARAVRSRVALFAPRDAWRYAARPYYDIGKNAFVADNKPYGANIAYYLAPTPAPARAAHAKARAKKAPPEKVTLEILDGTTVIRHLDATARGGINRVVWDLTTDPPGGPKAKQDPRPYYVFYGLDVTGPEVLPGRYTVRLIARGATLEAPLNVRIDPRVKASHAQLLAQYDALASLARSQETGETWLATIATEKKRIGKRDPKLVHALDALADALRNGNGSENAGYQQPAQPIDQIAYLRHIMATAFTGPTDAQRRAMDRYEGAIAALAPRARELFARARAVKTTASPRPARR
ncbi:MAG: glycosyl hydrolase [bacterium]|nr:glycosyl hydrolase [bacterium]